MIDTHKVPERWDLEVDLVCVGSSSGGLTAAIVGHDLGLRTVLLEKSEFLGGGTSLSGGVLWIPFNHIMLEEGLADSREEALTHIRSISLGRHDEELAATYLDTGPEVIRYIQDRTPLKMTIEASTDYYAEAPGGKKRGRQLYPDPEHMIPLLKEAEKTDPLVAKVRRDPVPFFCGLRDPWSEGRGLIGGLVLGCSNRGVDVRTGVRARRLILSAGRVIGLRAEHEGRDFFIRANKGVLLASGGYEWNAEMNKRFMNCPSLHAFTPNSNAGDGHVMGMEVGAAVALMDHSIYQPVYHVEGEESEGKPLYRPLSYGYPGDILVNRYGKRCCNESFYPDIGRAFVAYDKVTSQLTNAPIFWIADKENADGSGMSTLATMTKNADWFIQADTLPALAGILGIPADNLVATVDRFNQFAREGKDPDFRRGEGAYQHYWGLRGPWAGREPSATLGPLEKPPFYAIRLEIGTVGNLGGLVTNTNAQVMNTQGEAIPGLYGTSNTTALLTHGFTYTSGSCQAKSTIFGYIAARHMAREK
jgi:succinate dehydrogenase/fumarate reductase flavoprotein subunit